MTPADDAQWQLLVRMRVDPGDWNVVQLCLTMLQTMFVGVMFVLQRASDMQWVHDLQRVITSFCTKLKCLADTWKCHIRTLISN